MIVVWRVTQQCNLACGFCEWDRRLPRQRTHISSESVLRFGQLLAEFQKRTHTSVLLSWLGGEPALWPPLYEVVPELKRLGIAQSMTTNGTTLGSQRTQALVLQNFSELTVSVDGFAEFHDAIRGWQGGWELLRERIFQLVRLRHSNPLKLRINTVLMRDNIQAFPALCLTLAGWGVDEITFNTLGGRDRPEFFPMHSLRAADVHWLSEQIPALKAKLISQGVRLCASDEYLDRLQSLAEQKKVPIKNCAPAKSFLFINEFGYASPCNFTTDKYAMPIDHLTSCEDLLALPSFFSNQRLQKPHAACKDCPSTQVFAKFSA
jgi:sulfatase maturation enzyme AslB (radical SAM superfamily)